MPPLPSELALAAYALPVGRDWLVLGPFAGVRALVNRAARDALSRSPSDHDPRDLLRRPLRESVLSVPEILTGEVRPLFLGIVPTRACNAACVYCGFGAGRAPASTLPPDVMVRAIDDAAELACRSERRDLAVHFFGGEPFVASDLVEMAIYRARVVAAKLGLTPTFQAATNGLFDERTCDWIGRYVHTIVLSIDGPASVHDRQRPRHGGGGSFAQTFEAARRLANSAATLTLRVCVTSANQDTLESIAASFCETLRPASIDFEPLRQTPASIAVGITPSDPYRFAAQYWRARLAAASHGVRVTTASVDLDRSPRLSACPVGQDALIVTPDGAVSACYLPPDEWECGDLSLGRIGAELELSAERIERVRRFAVDRPTCARCFCRWSCAGGCHAHPRRPLSAGRYERDCVRTRLVTACEHLAAMGEPDLATRLVQDTEQMRALALQEDDRLWLG
jgi:uncharacterized protein